MDKKHNSTIAERHLSKNKKYYSYRSIKRDKENFLQGDINAIIQKITDERKLPKIAIKYKQRTMPQSVIDGLSLSQSHEKSKLAVNSVDFFEQEQQKGMKKKQLRKEAPQKAKCSLYQQYLNLSQQTNDYLQYYLTIYTGEDPGKATDLLKEQGKTIILYIIRKKYKCLDSNPQDINNRIFLAFNLNPLNDFQFVSWEKFMRLRKLISGDFNRQDYVEFLINYFFIPPCKCISGMQFWLIFSSVIRKLNTVMDASSLQVMLIKIKQIIGELVGENEQLTTQKLRQIIIKQSVFIWSQFVTLIFL